MIKVYIASTYTVGDVAVNVKSQLDVFDNLVSLGFAPYAPLWAHFQQIVHPLLYETWMNLAFEWIKVCDCVLRLDGESNGADREVEFAKEYAMKVFYTIEQLSKYYEDYM